MKGAFSLVLVGNTVVWWAVKNKWPQPAIAEAPVSINSVHSEDNESDIVVLVLSLLFLYILLLGGLMRSFADTAQLLRGDEEQSIPRGRWIYIICGLMTIVSGLLSGPPILLSPESAAGIKVTYLYMCVSCMYKFLQYIYIYLYIMHVL